MTSLSLNSCSVKSINRHWFFQPLLLTGNHIYPQRTGATTHLSPFLLFHTCFSASHLHHKLRMSKQGCHGCKKLVCLEEFISSQLVGGDWFDAAVTRLHAALWPFSGLFTINFCMSPVPKRRNFISTAAIHHCFAVLILAHLILVSNGLSSLMN